MTGYTPPLDDMRFVLHHVADLERDRPPAGLRGGDAGPGRRHPGGGRQVRGERAGAAQPERRSPARPARERRRAHARRLQGGLCRLRRGRLERPAVPRAMGRPGPALDGRDRGGRDVAQRQHGVRPLPAADPGRRGAAVGVRHRGAEGALSRQAGQRRMDRQHVPDRAACRQRRRRAQDPRRARGRPLPDPRHQDLHHLRRARLHRQHHPHGAGAPARRAVRHARHLAVPGAEVPGQRRRLAGAAQRSALRLARAQARHPREPDLRDVVRRRRGCDRLSGRRGAGRHGGDVHDDELRPRAGRARGPGDRRARLSGCSRLRARARPGLAPGWRAARARRHHRASRRAPDADRDGGADRGDAGAGLHRGRLSRSRHAGARSRRSPARRRAPRPA